MTRAFDKRCRSYEAAGYRILSRRPKGLFHLNRRLPIPFARRGTLEVDFFCPETRLVIEVDGDQHLADADAYRRDRQKDCLLQEHG